MTPYHKEKIILLWLLALWAISTGLYLGTGGEFARAAMYTSIGGLTMQLMTFLAFTHGKYRRFAHQEVG